LEAFYRNKLTNVSIPKNIKHVAEFAFAENVIESVHYYNTLEILEFTAFRWNGPKNNSDGLLFKSGDADYTYSNGWELVTNILTDPYK